MAYAQGTAATALGLTQAAEANIWPVGQVVTSPSTWMNNLIQSQGGAFSSLQSVNDLAAVTQTDLEAWAQWTGGLYGFSSQTTSTSAAWSSTPTTDASGTYSGAGPARRPDPAGTYSGAGASAPTPADPGTYIPVTGATSAADEFTDPAGTYSAAGASARRPMPPERTAPPGRARRQRILPAPTAVRGRAPDTCAAWVLRPDGRGERRDPGRPRLLPAVCRGDDGIPSLGSGHIGRCRRANNSDRAI